jgi:2',3'-cyclic-nucleotide 2'-phosphodiesterase (5'-nucleotidase family)
MNLRPFLRLLAVLALVTVFPLPAFGRGSEEYSNPELVVINMADTHSAYDTYPQILAAVERVSQAVEGRTLVFLFDGDLFELGNAAARKSKGVADWEFLSRLRDYGPVIVNIGNHEFDFLSPQEFIETARLYAIAVIGTIRQAAEGSLLAPEYVDLSAGPYIVRVVGVATNQINTYPKEVRDMLRIPDPVAWVQGNYRARTAGTDYSILLSHAGLTADLALLPTLPGSTLFAVGGHDHLVLRQKVSGIPYMHNGFCGERLNVAAVYLEETTPRVEFRDILTADIAETDAEMAATIASVRRQYLNAGDNAIVGRVPEDMTVLEAANWAVETVRDAMGADAAFLNHTSFGSGLQAGPLARYRFDNFMRFDNDVMQATVDAATLRTILSMSNQQRYLGTNVAFEKVPEVTTKGILLSALK